MPHYLPGKNPHLLRAQIRYGLPVDALKGGAGTTYPEFQLKSKNPSRASQRPEPRATNVPAVPSQQVTREKGNVLVIPVQGNVYVLVGDGGNTTVQVGENSVFVVDTQTEAMAPQILAAIRDISKKPIRYIINTHAHADHTGGNAAIAGAGHSSGTNGDGFGGNSNVPARASAAIVAHLNVLQRMSGRGSSLPPDAVPSDAYDTADYRLFNGEGVQIIHEPAAHTNGDSIVFFRRSDVISAGDVFSTVSYPVIDRQSGGSVNGIIAALNHIIDLSIPRDKQEGGTYIIPGHGRISDQADVVEYRDIVTIIRDRIDDMIKRGLTLEQIQAERPTFEFDNRYNNRSWTKEMVVEAVYRDLTATKNK